MNHLRRSLAWTTREARLLGHRGYGQFNGGTTYMPTGPRDNRYQSAYNTLNQNAVTRGYVDVLSSRVGQRVGRMPPYYQGYASRHPQWNPMTAGRMNYAAHGNGLPTYHATHMGYAPGGGYYGGGMGTNYQSGAIGGGASGFYGGGYMSSNAMQYSLTGLATSGYGYSPMMGAMSMGGYQPNGLQQGFGMNADGMRPRSMTQPAYYPPAPYQRTGTPGLYTANQPGNQYAMNTGYQNPNYGQDYGNNFYTPRPIGQYMVGVQQQQQQNPYMNVPGAPLYGQQMNASTRQAMLGAQYGSHTYTWDSSGNLIHFVPPQQTYRGAQRRTAPANGGTSQTPNQGYGYQSGGNGYQNNGYTNNGNGGFSAPPNNGYGNGVGVNRVAVSNQNTVNTPLPNIPNPDANQQRILTAITRLQEQIAEGSKSAAALEQQIGQQRRDGITGAQLDNNINQLGILMGQVPALTKSLQELRQNLEQSQKIRR